MHLDRVSRRCSQSQCALAFATHSRIDKHRSLCQTGDAGASQWVGHKSNEHRQSFEGMSKEVTVEVGSMQLTASPQYLPLDGQPLCAFLARSLCIATRGKGSEVTELMGVGREDSEELV
jgi:hypothetical protein